MQGTELKKLLSCVLCFVLITASALTLSACTENDGVDSQTNNSESSVSSDQCSGVTKLGEGAVYLDFRVVGLDGVEHEFEIHTDKTTVGDALLELDLISGEAGPYGLYVKTVNGVTLDYDTDGKYWAFYVNGEYGLAGVDSTEIEENTVYSFRAE